MNGPLEHFEALRGHCRLVGINHGKPVYHRACTLKGFGEATYDMFIYFWDGAGDPTWHGWWIGQTVGGVRAIFQARCGWRFPASLGMGDSGSGRC